MIPLENPASADLRGARTEVGNEDRPQWFCLLMSFLHYVFVRVYFRVCVIADFAVCQWGDLDKFFFFLV